MGTEGEVTDDAHGEAIKRDSHMEAYRKRVVKVSVWVVLAVLAPGCEHYKPSVETVGNLAGDPLQSLAAVERIFEGRKPGPPCYTWPDLAEVTSFSVSSTRLHITCSSGKQLSFRYRDTPEIVVTQIGRAPFITFLRDKDGKMQEFALATADESERAKEFVRGWFVLVQPRKLQDPAIDSVFSDAVKRYQADPQTHAEILRRAQVQVESALKEHHVREAATIYRDTLKSAAGWPEGHFNLALLFGDQEFYTDAINEMRRYLFLVPTAPDARAAQDKIYEWERKTQ